MADRDDRAGMADQIGVAGLTGMDEKRDSSRAPFSGETADPETVTAMLEEERRDTAEFSRLLELARKPDSSHQEVYGREAEDENDDVVLLASHHSHMDRYGNPTWIKLAPRTREEGREGGAPEEETVTVSGGMLSSSLEESLRERGRAGAKKKETVGRKTDGKGGIFRLFGRAEADKEQESLASRRLREQEGKGMLLPRKARPMHSFFRVLLATVVLGLLYHFLATRGWVPKLF